MSRARRAAVFVGVCMVALVAVVNPASATPNNTVEVIRSQGSDTTLDLMQNLDRAYNTTAGCLTTSTPQRLDHVCGVSGPPFNDPGDATKYENWDHDVAMSFHALGSSAGISMLTNFGLPGNARIEVARSSRVKGGSDNAGLRFIAYAKDALSPTNFRGDVDAGTCDVDRTNTEFPEFDDDGPLTPGDVNDGTWADGPDAGSCNDATVATSVDNLSNQQIKDIWVNCGGSDSPTDVSGNNNGIMDWQDLDSTKPAIPIIVWNTNLSSGTRGTWNTFLTGSSSGATDNCIPAGMKNANLSDGNRIIFEHDALPIVNCATDDDGAGPEGIDCPDENLGDGFGVHYTHSFYYYGVGAHSVSESDPKGEGADLMSIGGVTPTPDHIKGIGGQYLYARDVFNVIRHSFAANNAPDFVRDYVGEQGWICKNASKHAINPKTGLNYRTQVEQVISQSGFVPLDDGATGVGGNSHCRVT